MPNVNQYNVLHKIKKYLELNNIDANFRKEFSPGHCIGISILWAFAKWLQTQPETGNARDDYTWFKSTIESIIGWDETKKSLQLPNGKLSKLAQNFEQFIAKIEYFHNVQNYLPVSQGDLSKKVVKQLVVAPSRVSVVKGDPGESVLSYCMKDEAGTSKVKNIEQEYSIAALFTLEQLKQLLRTPGIIQEHKLITILTHDHGTALFKDGDGYYFFDPNCPDFIAKSELKASSTDQIAELIFSANLFKKLLPSPIGFRMFYFDKKSLYPDAKTVLSMIKPKLKSSKGYADGTSGLLQAVRINSLDSVRYYLALGKQIDVDEKNNNGVTALMYAGGNGLLEVAQELIRANANLEAKDNFGWTALMFAAFNGHLEVVQALILAHANLEAKNNDSQTALMFAANNGHLEVVQILIDAHVNLEKKFKTKNSGSWTVLMVAANNGYSGVVQALKQAGANIDAKATDNYNMTALMYAAEDNCCEMVKKLIELGANINEKETNGYTALMIAAEKGNTEAAKELIAAHVAAHTGFEEKGNDECTALMIAVINNNIVIARELIKAGACLDTENGENKTALMLATERCNQEMIELLVPKVDQKNRLF